MFEQVLNLANYITSLLEQREKNSKKLFINHIKPSFYQFSEIHNNYIIIFENIYQAISKSDFDICETISDLRLERLEEASKREELKTLMAAICRRSLPHNHGCLLRNKEVNVLVSQYAISILRYFRVAIHGQRKSMHSTHFTSLLHILRSIHVAMDSNDVISHPSPELLKAKTAVIKLSKYMNATFATTCATYSELKLMCL